MSQIAYKVHPKIGKLYDQHMQFFNDGIVELMCLMIANVFIIILSYFFIGLSLAIILTFTATPITYCIKYLLHKHWVWKKE